MSTLTGLIDPALAVKVVAILACLSAIQGVLAAFGNPTSKLVVVLQKILDVVGYNPKH